MAKTGDDWRTPPPAPDGEDVHSRTIIAAVSDLASRVGALVDIITRNDSYRRWIMTLLAGNLIALIAIAVPGALFATRLADLAASNHRANRILVECTTAGNPTAADVDDRVHECYDQARANQAQAINKIIDTNGNGIPDTLELLANQAASARARGIDLPFPEPPPTTTTTTPRPSG